jgi:cell division protein FtsW (lipid II flippase)
MEIALLHIRTVAAIMVWFVVVLLFLNRLLRSEWITPIAIVLTVIAVLVYFSPRLRKGTKSDKQEIASATIMTK